MRRQHATAILNRGRNNAGVGGDVRVYTADLRFPEAAGASLGKETFDVIVDFYSRTKEDMSGLFAVFSGRCAQYVFISSACVYRRSNESAEAISEDSPKPNTLWDYGMKKYEAERQLMSMSGRHGCRYTIVRPYITYDDERVPWGIAPAAYRLHRTILERIRCGKPMFVWDGGANYCTLTYCGDFAEALVGLFLNPKAEDEDFHITGDCRCQWKDVLSALYEALDVPPNIVDIPTGLVARHLPEYRDMLVGDRSLNAVFDNRKIKEAVPYAALSTSLEEGLKKVIGHYEALPTFSYDFKYDARMDRLLSRCGARGLRFVPYPRCGASSRKVYLAYRYLPLRVAGRLCASW